MVNVSGEVKEHRRAQNRMAQRRFRQRKQANRAAAEQDKSAQDQEVTFYPSCEVLSPMPRVSSPTDTPHRLSTLPGGYADSISFSDMESDFTQYALTAATSQTVATPPTDSVDLNNIFELGLVDDSSSFHHKRLGSMARATTEPDSPPPSGLNSPRQSSSRTGIDEPGIEGSGFTGTGWLGALHMAARQGHAAIVQILLQNNMDSNEHDSDHLTPLMHAAAGGHVEVASMLLAHGVRLSDVDDRRRSALHRAVMSRHEGLLRLLLKYAAGDPSVIDGYDDSGRTPLHIAIESGFERGVAILLEFSANIHSRARKL